MAGSGRKQNSISAKRWKPAGPQNADVFTEFSILLSVRRRFEAATSPSGRRPSFSLSAREDSLHGGLVPRASP